MTEAQLRRLHDAADAFNSVLQELYNEGAKELGAFGQLFSGVMMVFSTSPTMLRTVLHMAQPIFAVVSELHNSRCVAENGITPYQALNLMVLAGRMAARRNEGECANGERPKNVGDTTGSTV